MTQQLKNSSLIQFIIFVPIIIPILVSALAPNLIALGIAGGLLFSLIGIFRKLVKLPTRDSKGRFHNHNGQFVSSNIVFSSYVYAGGSIGVFIFPEISDKIVPIISEIGSVDVQILAGLGCYLFGCFLNR